MKKQWRDMLYDGFHDCWMIFWDDGKRYYKMRCGESFEIHFGEGNHILCRLELGSDWYIIVGQNNTKLFLKPYETYQVSI